MKKTALIIVVLVCFATIASAGVPRTVNFQGRLNNSSGNPVANGTYSIKFSIYTTATGGTALWSQTYSVMTNNGVFNVLLTNFPLLAESSAYYLGMKVGTDAEMTPRQQLTSSFSSIVSGAWYRTYLNFDGSTPGHHWVRANAGSEPGNIFMGYTFNGTQAETILFMPRGILGMVVTAAGRVGIGTYDPTHTLDVNGTLHVSGADLAEPFDMTDIDVLELGDVVVIDPQNSMHVTKSTTAYDTMVAGIVSSTEQAGYVAGSRSDGTSDKPVALVGRVLCNVSTENGAIKIGDLLTTSNTPGYAMKATDKDRMNGTLLGKALQAFDGDKGQIMVLVALQ